jgi:hypothetical protein
MSFKFDPLSGTLLGNLGSSGGGGTSIGGAVTGGVAENNLYVGPGGVLAQEPRLALLRAPDGALNQVLVGQGVGSSPAYQLIGDSSIAAAGVANIARNKLASGSADHVIINNGTGVMSSEAQLAMSRGGTGSSSFSAGSIPFSDGTSLTQDNSNLYFDDTNNRLGLGITSPQNRIHIDAGTGTASSIQFSAGATTGQSATDGTLIGIQADGSFRLLNQDTDFSNFLLHTGLNGVTQLGANAGARVEIATTVATQPRIRSVDGQSLLVSGFNRTTGTGSGTSVTVSGGDQASDVASPTGSATLRGGLNSVASSAFSGGAASVLGGNANGTGSTGNGGSISITSGSSVGGASGSIAITGALANGSGAGGNITLTAGRSTSGTNGSIILQAGNPSTAFYTLNPSGHFVQSSSAGQIQLKDGTVSLPALTMSSDLDSGIANVAGLGGFTLVKDAVRFLFSQELGSVFLGRSAGNLSITGEYNTAVGWESGLSLTTGNLNTLVGRRAGRLMTTGAENTFVGWDAGGQAAQTGSRNVGIGAQAGASLTSGAENIFMGYLAGSYMDSGSSNIGIGYEALRNCLTTSSAVAIGKNSQSSTFNTGTGNISIGENSLTIVSTGSGNTAVGHFSGASVTTGSNNLVLGRAAEPSSATASNEFVVGSAGFPLSTGTAGADVLTFTNGPTGTAGNPDIYIQIRYNGVNYVVPGFAV